VDKFNLIYGESEKRTLEASLWHDRKDKAIANWNARVKNSDNYLQAAPTQSN
jgi:hypothetical protein